MDVAEEDGSRIGDKLPDSCIEIKDIGVILNLELEEKISDVGPISVEFFPPV